MSAVACHMLLLVRLSPGQALAIWQLAMCMRQGACAHATSRSPPHLQRLHGALVQEGVLQGELRGFLDRRAQRLRQPLDIPGQGGPVTSHIAQEACSGRCLPGLLPSREGC